MANSPKSAPSSGLKAPGLKAPLHPLRNPTAWLRAFWQFSRPHTVIGTSLSTLALLLIAIAASPIPFSMQTVAISWLVAWVACLCGNVYIVGLNQVEDIAIDRINKPQLPIASGEFTKRHAQGLVWLCGVGAIALSAISQNLYLMLTVGLSLVIGTAYSLPPDTAKALSFLGLDVHSGRARRDCEFGSVSVLCNPART